MVDKRGGRADVVRVSMVRNGHIERVGVVAVSVGDREMGAYWKSGCGGSVGVVGL